MRQLSLFVPIVLAAFCAIAQPLKDGEETLSVEAQSFELVVPEQEGLSGGHLQGVQLHNGTLIVSGSSKSFGYLAFFQLLKGDFKFLGLKKLAQKPLNHAGGFQVADNWLAVGVEDPKGKRESVIQIIDISTFENISAPPVYSLARKGEWKFSTAGAVALLKRKDHFLLAVGSWDSTTIDFYRSNHLNPKAEDFEFERWTTWDSREAIRKSWISKSYGSYQNLQLTQDETGVYLSGFHRTKNGSNQVDVFKLNPGADPYTLIDKVGVYSVQCNNDVTFRNGGGFSTFFGLPSILAVGHNLVPKTRVQIFPIKAD
ncbi:MAG: hypothetical protein ACPGU4_13090 [Flavobacteriales bacterium]